MIDPLNLKISGVGVQTTIPIIPEADYTFQITESKIQPNKAQDGQNWHMVLQTTSPATSIDGREVPVGHKLFNDIGLQPGKDSTDPEAFKRNIFAAVDAIFGTDETSRPDFTLDLANQALGKPVIGRVVVDEWKGDKNNKIKKLKKVA